MSDAGVKFAVTFRSNEAMLQAAEDNLQASTEYDRQVKEHIELLNRHLAAYAFATPAEQSQYGHEVELGKEMMKHNQTRSEQLARSVAAVARETFEGQ
jgi:hypothetical protein